MTERAFVRRVLYLFFMALRKGTLCRPLSCPCFGRDLRRNAATMEDCSSAPGHSAYNKCGCRRCRRADCLRCIGPGNVWGNYHNPVLTARSVHLRMGVHAALYG